MLTIASPSMNDVDALLAFELENRDYFEQWVQARPQDYYSQFGVQTAIQTAIEDIEQDRAYQFLIRSESSIVGRVNLVGVTRKYFNKAVLGYRVGHRSGGKGYASQAVSLAMEIAERDLRLSRIEAVVRSENGASIRVLEQNGFSVFGRTNQSMYLHGVWSDQIHYERRLGRPGVPPVSGPGDIR